MMSGEYLNRYLVFGHADLLEGQLVYHWYGILTVTKGDSILVILKITPTPIPPTKQHVRKRLDKGLY